MTQKAVELNADIAMRLGTANRIIWELTQIVEQFKNGKINKNQMVIQFNTQLYWFDFEYEKIEELIFN